MLLKSIVFLTLICVTLSIDRSVDTSIYSRQNDWFNRSKKAEKFCQEGFETAITQEEIQMAAKVVAETKLEIETEKLGQMLDARDLNTLQTRWIKKGIPGAIGAIIILLIWPFLCCCCTCPNTHPVCDGLRKLDTDQPYSTFEMKWPPIGVILMCAIFVAGGVSVLKSNSHMIGHDANSAMCKMMRFQDYMINGFTVNASMSGNDLAYTDYNTADKESFSGFLIAFLDSQNLMDDISILNTEAARLNGAGGQMSTEQTALETKLGSISIAGITYTNAFYQSDMTPIAVPSTIPAQMGSTSDSGTILGETNSNLQTIFAQVNNTYERLSGALPYAAFSYYDVVSMTRTKLSLTTWYMWEQEAKNYNKYSGGVPEVEKFNQYLRPFFIACIAVAGVAALVSLIILLFSWAPIRNLLYFLCFLITILSLICFILAILVGAFNFLIPQACVYLEEDFTVGLGVLHFKYSKEYYDLIRKHLSDCTAGGGGNIIKGWGETDIDPDAPVVWQSLTDIFTVVFEFDDLVSSYNTTTFADFNTMYRDNWLQKIRRGSILDVEDSDAIAFLKAVAYHTLPDPSNICAAQVKSDTFVPAYDSVIGCRSFPEQPLCSDLSDLTICQEGCYGMYDEFNNGDFNYANNLALRYNSGCIYVDRLVGLQDNWIAPLSIKVDQCEAQLDDLFDRATTSYWNQLDTFKSDLNSATSPLRGFTMSWPHTGAGRRSDCRLLQSPADEIKNIACGRAVPKLRTLLTCLLMMGISGILLMMFTVCTGVRQFKEMERKRKSVVTAGEQPSEYKFVDSMPPKSNELLTAHEVQMYDRKKRR